ncbi:MAG: hypothetical protein LKJ17_12580 [Oscillospiraceae bacterium]|nr:hypothetical protein [Oscillospiraceae bacterium]
MKLGKLKTGSIFLVLIFGLAACSNGGDPNRLVNLQGSVTQDNLVYHIESIERLKNIKTFDKTLFEQHPNEPKTFDEQGNVAQESTFFDIKISIENKSGNAESVYVNGIGIYKVDQQLKADMKSRSEIEYFSRPQKKTKELYKADIAPNTKETYDLGYFVDDDLLDNPALCLVINPMGYQFDNTNIHFISLNK